MRIDNIHLDAKGYSKLHQALVHLHAMSLLIETSGDNGIMSIKLDLPTNTKSKICYVYPFIKKSTLSPVLEKAYEMNHQGLLAVSYLYRAGIGVPKDEVLSEIWFNFAHQTVTVVDNKEVDLKKCFARLKRHLKDVGENLYLEDYINQSQTISENIITLGDHKARNCVAVPRPKGIDATFIYSKQLDGSYLLYAIVRPNKGVLERILTLRSSEGSSLKVPTIIRSKFKSSFIAVVTRAVVTDPNNVIVADESVKYSDTDVLKMSVGSGTLEKSDVIPVIDRLDKKGILSPEAYRELGLKIESLSAKKLKAKAKARLELLIEQHTAERWKQAAVTAEINNKGRVLATESLTFYAYDMLVGSSMSSFRSPKVSYARLTKVLTTEGFNVMPYVECTGRKINVKKLKLPLEYSNVVVRKEKPVRGDSDISLWAKHKV